MKVEQAIGITIGANIGTCVTSIMIGLNVEQFAYYLVFIGVVIMFLAKKKDDWIHRQSCSGLWTNFCWSTNNE